MLALVALVVVVVAAALLRVLAVPLLLRLLRLLRRLRRLARRWHDGTPLGDERCVHPARRADARGGDRELPRATRLATLRS